VGEREQAREAIAESIHNTYKTVGVPEWKYLPSELKESGKRFADQILSLKWPDGSPMVVVTSQDQSITAETMQIIEGRPFLLVDAEEFKAGWVKKAEGG